MLLAGRAQVHVRVDEGGEQVASGPVDDLDVGGRVDAAGRRDLRDRAVADEDVARAVDVGARVEHVDAAQQQVRGAGGGADEPRGVGDVAGELCGAHASCGSVGRGAVRASRAPASTS